MNELTFNILKIVVAVATVFISAYVIPLLKEKLNDSRYNRLLDMVEIAVRAAEQTIKADGAVKKDEVVKFVTQWMLAHGIAITQEQLDQLIECAVYNLKMEAK
jgi:LL-H family phage holin